MYSFTRHQFSKTTTSLDFKFSADIFSQQLSLISGSTKYRNVVVMCLECSVVYLSSDESCHTLLSFWPKPG